MRLEGIGCPLKFSPKVYPKFRGEEVLLPTPLLRGVLVCIQAPGRLGRSRKVIWLSIEDVGDVFDLFDLFDINKIFSWQPR